MKTGQKTYCTELQSSEKHFVKQIITKMRGNIDILPHINLKVGSSIVGDVEVVVYEIPASNFLAWVCTIALTLIAAASGTAIGIGFRKDSNVWDAGHVLANLPNE